MTRTKQISGVNTSGTVLVVDDDPSCLKMTVELLRRGGYQCDEATDAYQAVKLLSEKVYDLLISDLEMPGNEDLRLIREVPQIAAGLPVILITAYPTVETAVQSIHLPVAAYIVKPFSKEKFLEQVQKAIEGHQALRALRVNHQRIAEWNKALEQIASTMKLSRPQETAPWQALLDLTLKNITDSVIDLRVFVECTSRQTGPKGKDDAPDKLQPLMLLNALRETIAVLEKTRSSFKSKDLGELRRKLEMLLDGKPDRTKPADEGARPTV